MANDEGPDDEVVQVVLRLSRRERRQLNHIARARRERDSDGGRGAQVVLRRAVRRYIGAHRDELPDDER